MVMQIRRTSIPDRAPNNLSLVPGQLAVEMASNPPRLWCGVPTTVDPTGRRVVIGRRTEGGVGIFMTGDVKFTFKQIADPGFVMCDDGTIGPQGSGATFADDDTEALFTLLFDEFSDVHLPIFTSAGVATTRNAQGTVANAWDERCRIALTKTFGRALAIGGQGAGLTNRPLGSTVGAEQSAMAANEIPSHDHGRFLDNFGSYGDASNPYVYTDSSITSNIFSHAGTTGTDTGSMGVPHSSMQPTTFLNVMICL